MPEPVLRVRDLVVRDGRRHLVGPLDLDVAPGERVALLGPSGSGKSLTVCAAVGALPPGLSHDGEVTVTRRVAWMQQDSSAALHPLVPLGRQLERPLRRRGADRATARGRARAALARVGLTERHAASRPGRLSGGERQRGCLALAMLGDPELLLADEPTTALDTVAQRRVLDVVAELDLALVLVTHDAAVAAHACTRAVRLGTPVGAH